MKKQSEFAHLLPCVVEVKEGVQYRWCSCGKSNTQPFCDRKDCGDKAIIYTATLTEEVSFCNCKQTKTPPFCDGSHSKLLMDYLKKIKDKDR